MTNDIYRKCDYLSSSPGNACRIDDVILVVLSIQQGTEAVLKGTEIITSEKNKATSFSESILVTMRD